MLPDHQIAALRACATARKQRHRCVFWTGGSPVTAAASLRASENEPSWPLRCARRAFDRLAAIPFAGDELELLAGRFDFAALPAGVEALADADIYLADYPGPGGQTGHCELDRERVFAVGIAGLRAELQARIAANDNPAERTLTWQTFDLALAGLTVMIRHAADAVDRTLAGASPAYHEHLRNIAASCRRIAEAPPAGFLDALHLVWFMDMAVTHADCAGLVAPGHLDRTLIRYYNRDLAEGCLTREQALRLLRAFYLMINEHVPDGLAVPIMVGGCDSHGRDLTNDLSYLCLEALRETALAYPTVGICWHEATPRDLLDLAVEIIGEGIPTPAFFGDATIQRGLQHYGVPAAAACAYINSTCVEITPVGASNVWVASPYFSVCQTLLAEIADQAAGPAAPTFTDFLAAYHNRLSAEIAAAAAEQNALRAARQAKGGKPLQSVFTADCIDRGRDIDAGGARYNWVMCSFVGLANLVDSLVVIRDEVYDSRRLSMVELHQALLSNFADAEALRLRFLNRHAKYGNDCAEADALFAEIVAAVRAACSQQRMAPDNSPLVPGSFCWVMHERLGRACGATPDGRCAGFPFADGGGPAQGREKRGPTAAILSTTSWDHSPMIGGVAYNMRFSKALLASPGQRQRLGDLVITYLRRGGFETQINVVDREILRQARAQPEQHRDLLVRIGGYTDYFARLTAEMQEEVMQRTEYGEL